MPDDGAISELKSMVGVKGKPLVVEIEKGRIRSIAEAIGDPNPLWQDEACARKSRYGGITAPPGFLAAYFMSTPGRPKLPLPSNRRLDGGGEWEFIKPIRPGDTITSVTSFSGLEEKEGKRGKMYLLVFTTTYTNQNGELAARSRSTTVYY